MTDGLRNAAVIGTGMMGPGIALTLALGGWRTAILSRSEANAARGLEKARVQAGLLAENELVDGPRAVQAVSLLRTSADFDDTVRGAGLVIESGPEDMAFKQELFARMDALTGPETLLASNTSGLSITAIAERCARPERVLTAHFWNPPHLMPLVEIVLGGRTSQESAETLRAVLEKCGKTPVMVRQDRPGQLGNRLQMALLREAANMIAEGIAGAEDIDSVLRNGLGLRMPGYGLLEHMDVVGLNLGLAVLEYVARDLYSEPRAPEYVRELVRRGDLGAAAGQGFYDWSVKSADEVRASRDASLIAILRYRRKAGGRQSAIG
jgi:3-hydroxybutyryl-CoA dehydrogenase